MCDIGLAPHYYWSLSVNDNMLFVCLPPELLLEIVLHDWLFSKANGTLFCMQQWALSLWPSQCDGLAKNAIVPPSLVQYQSAMLLVMVSQHAANSNSTIYWLLYAFAWIGGILL